MHGKLPIPQSESMDDYLASSEMIDWRVPEVASLARDLTDAIDSDVEKASRLYAWVRDTIPHSIDAGHATVTCRASDVVRRRTGMCFAKSHLLAAMLRSVNIPAGMCYQVLQYDAERSDWLTLHGLNGIYLKSVGRWIRVDARGNKNGVNAQFRLDGEQLAFPVRPALGELNYPAVFAEPLPSIVECLTTTATVGEALAKLPRSIDGSHVA
jgi:transglutaminase-like putative cysteine protease